MSHLPDTQQYYAAYEVNGVYTPLIQYMQVHGGDLDLIRRGMQACKLPEALQRDVLNQLQQGTVTKSNGHIVA